MAESSSTFDVVSIGLASPRQIRAWSRGEVKKPETINYRTFKPERDGLFCERIFGPSRDWECHCGKYKKVKFKGIICDRCGVEVTRAKVRRRRMGHIELAAPVVHIWYLKGVPSPISLLLNMSSRLLEKVVYFASYIVTHVDRDRINKLADEIAAAAEEEKLATLQERDAAIEELKRRYEEGLRTQAEAAAREEQEEQGEFEEALVEEELEEEDQDGDEDGDELEEVADEGSDLGGLAQILAEEPRPQALTEEELTARIQAEHEHAEERQRDIDQSLTLLMELEPKQLITEIEYRNLTQLLEICEERVGQPIRDVFRAGLGGEAIKELLRQIDLDELAHDLRKEIEERTGARRAKAIKWLQVVEAFRKSKNRPEWMVLDVVPVLPPELRPMVQLDGGRFATSDLNDLYRRIINRNNRLRRIVEIKAPESIINHEKRLLQEAVDALIDNGRRARPVSGSNKRPLKSLSDMLKGKEGRFRKNLLGKRVDYSGRSVIVVGPKLRLHECGLPREMALELFKPFVMKRLVQKGYTTNIKTAKRMVDRLRSEVWDALEEVIQEHPILLNRAPTLHRLGIQAFEPVLVEGKAIQLHPLVCHAFNADFDGDQMAAHVPLSAHAQAEARLLMMSSVNLFKPADGKPVSAPLYDIVLGCYYLTQQSPGAKGTGHVYENPDAVELAFDHGQLDLHAAIKCRVRLIEASAEFKKQPMELDPQLEIDLRRTVALAHERGEDVTKINWQGKFTKKLIAEIYGSAEENGQTTPPAGLTVEDELAWWTARAMAEGRCPVSAVVRVAVKRQQVETTAGRVIWNNLLPLDMQFSNKDIAKSELAEITERCHQIYGPEKTVELLDKIKDIGFKFAMDSGISICLKDTDIPTPRERLIAQAEAEVRATNKQHAQGLITQGEREQKVLDLWQQVREDIADAILAGIDRFNPLYMMTNSGARAKRTHICQISGMRGLMCDPFGRMIEDLPVKSNFREGLNVLEYFVSTHGARKGLADVALRTADAGYLTRRLVDVAQDVIIRAEDCGTTEGIEVAPMYEEEVHCPACGEEDLHRLGRCQHCGAEIPGPIQDACIQPLSERVIGRIAAADIRHPETNELIVSEGKEITEHLAERMEAAGVRVCKIRSPLTCELRQGICARCYGRDLATGHLVDVGTAVGIIAAQSIGEPGTQITMWTFHTGGIAGQYLTGVAEVKKRKQEALRSLHEDVDRGLVSLETGMGEREQLRAIQEMLKVLETPVHGLLRVVELFEARRPKGQAITSSVDGVVADVETKGLRTVVIHSEQPLDDPRALRGERAAEKVVNKRTKKVLVEENEKITEKVVRRLQKAGVEKIKIRINHLVPYRGELFVREGIRVRAGDRLTAGPLDPQKVLQLKGVRGVQEYVLREIQAVYRSQGVTINDKHIEVIVRQMLRKRKIREHGDTDFLPGQVVDRFAFEDENKRVRELGGREATADWVLLGITEASLATDSFLSAASFQRTTRVLAQAATAGKRDHLVGLKENVIIGRLIPAGSGMPVHRDVEVDRAPGVEEPVAAVQLAAPLEATTELGSNLDAAELLQSSVRSAIAELDSSESLEGLTTQEAEDDQDDLE